MGGFLSTLSLRRATTDPLDWYLMILISIHALLAESDGVLNSLEIRSITISIHALLAESDGPGVGQGPPHHNFYPRSPCGERQRCFCSRLDVINFYPRSPCGERPGRYQIPSHRHPHFYPRSPCGERPLPRSRPGSGFPISIHALLAESDGVGQTGQQNTVYFYPRSPCGERPLKFILAFMPYDFYPRSPCGERPL